MIARTVAALAATVVLAAGCSTGDDAAAPNVDAAVQHQATPAGADAGATQTTSAREQAVDEPHQSTAGGDESGDQLTAANASLEAPPPPDPLEPAARGDAGEHVERLQERLAELGFGPGTPDGDYGARTATAVAAFQALVGLDPTGDADRTTAQALVDYRYEGLLLRAGAEGPVVEALQQQLADGPFDPGPADGEYGRKTIEAVWALEKLAGIPVDGDWGPLDAAAWERLIDGEIGRPTEAHEVRWVEFDLSQQLLKVYDPGASAPTLISHASSGSGIPWENEDHSGSSITPLGDFEINRRIAGWRESSLGIGRLYNPLYFTGGIAFHGSQSVPLYPASHGCVRVPMHIAEYLPDELPNGTPVHVLE